MKKKYAVIDIETTGLSAHNDKITMFGLYLPDLDEYIINRGDPHLPSIREHLKGREIIYHNGKFDVGFLMQQTGVRFPYHHDTMVLAYLTETNIHNSLSLKNLAVRKLGVLDWDVDLDTKTGGGSATDLIEYLKKDLLYTWQLFVYYSKWMPKNHRPIYYDIMMPAIRAYTDIESRGMYIEMSLLDIVRTQRKHMVADLQAQLDSIAQINWNSTKQVGTVLYDQLGLPVLDRTKSGAPSTGVSTLKKLATGSEVPRLILDYRNATKSIGTFLDRWDKDQNHGRIYPSFGITTTATGRTSCRNPNLQQVPRDKDLRSLFRAPRGWTFVNIDYSQLELRFAAVISGDETMMNAYRNRQDLHTITAQGLVGEGNEVTKADRTNAKAVNFGFLYGMLPPSFVTYAYDTFGLTLTESDGVEYRERFFDTYPGLKVWHVTQVEEAKVHSGVYNMYGRFRSLPNINNRNAWFERSQDERRALNTVVQGSASDTVLKALIRVHQQIVRDKYRGKVHIVGTVHDSVMFEIKNEYLEEAIRDIVPLMEQVPDEIDMKGVPLKVDVEVGPWGKGEEYEV